MTPPDSHRPPSGLAERLRRALREEQDALLMARARARGLVNEAAVSSAEAAREQSGDPRPLSEILVATGALAAESLARLENEQAAEDFARRSTAVRVPPEIEMSLSDPDRLVDAFVLHERLASGGSGEVWRAWDRRLGRWVALKISNATVEDAAARERFAREALAVARLDHPHILPVFEVGSTRGRAFLVMPLIEGQTLEKLVQDKPLPIQQALSIMAVVAGCVAHAHERGIFHRDIKPGNVMLDREGRVFVLDFGLALLRAEASLRLTRPGEIMGTPSYMAPEQARGDSTTAPDLVDIYGIGATVYFLVTGHAPFVGESFAQVVAQVVTAEPKRPRSVRPEVTADVEAVILKAMEKTPSQRYPSARALSTDLQKLLAGQSVEARIQSRLRRWFRRQTAGALLALALAGAGATAVGMAVVARRRAINEGKAAARALVDLARLSLDTTLRLRRAGDVFGMRHVLPQVALAYDKVADRGALTAETEYLMGRTYRALLDPERALAHQQRAIAFDPTFGPALYERAVLLSRQYGQALVRLRAQPIGEARAPATLDSRVESADSELTNLRTHILTDADRLAATPLGEARSLAARGILAYHRSLHDEARSLLNRALAADPDMEEAWEALAQNENAAGRNAFAIEAYTSGIKHDKGYVPFYVGRCELRRWPQPQEAEADARQALMLDPSSVEARACQGGILLFEGHKAMMAGEDPRQILGLAIADLSAILSKKKSASAFRDRGDARRYLGMYLLRHGGDPRPALAASEDDITHAIGLEPKNWMHVANRARTRAVRAEWLWQDGQDFEPDLALAKTDLDTAGVTQKQGTNAPMWRADLHALRASIVLLEGGLPQAEIVAAEADFARAQTIMPKADPWLSLLRGGLRVRAGMCQARAGRDPVPVWQQAEIDLDAARAALPRDTKPVTERARLGLQRGIFLASRRPRGGAADFAAAAELLDAVLVRDPNLIEALWLRGQLRTERRDIDGARRDLRQAIDLHPGMARWIDIDLRRLGP